MEDTAALIRRSRRRAGLSQAELARRSSVPQPAISAYEAGTRQPAFDTARALLAACGTPVVVQVPRGTVDRERAARHLEKVLALADALPRKRPPAHLGFPALHRPG